MKKLNTRGLDLLEETFVTILAILDAIVVQSLRRLSIGKSTLVCTDQNLDSRSRSIVLKNKMEARKNGIVFQM